MPCDFFLIGRNSIVYCYKLCAIRKGFFGMFVEDNMGEFMMLRNLHGLDFTRNCEDETYCRNRFWTSVELKFGRICLVIRPTLAFHMCWKFLGLMSRTLGSMTKKTFDDSVNLDRVVIEHAFGALKNRWRILKYFSMNMDKVATVTLTCCVLHNFCKIYAKRVPLLEDVAQRPDLFVGVRRGAMRLHGDGRAGNLAGEQMRTTIFESWVARNPNE